MNKETLDKAKKYLARRDAVLKRVMREVGELRLPYLVKDPFNKLIRSIIGQQLSVKAAATIFLRLKDELLGKGERALKPHHILKASDTKLRSAGVSGAKALALRDLAKHCESGALTARKLERLSDEKVKELLVGVRGVGPWTAEMYLMFGLGRLDVLPVDDLGLQNGVMKAYGLKRRPNKDELAKLGETWAPYRSVATHYLWQYLEV